MAPEALDSLPRAGPLWCCPRVTEGLRLAQVVHLCLAVCTLPRGIPLVRDSEGWGPEPLSLLRSPLI